MHFFMGLLFLFFTIILVTIYFITIYLLYVGFTRLLYYLKYRYYFSKYNKDIRKDDNKKFRPFYLPKVYLKIIFLTFLILCGVYTIQRIEWMGEDNAHLTAKEYWVSGQVVASIRFALVRVLHPENPLLWPYNRLQKVIYDKGIKYLPKEDGEIGIWTDAWFIYPYNRRGLLPKVSVDSKFGRHLIDPVFKADKKFPKIISHLDRCWFALETMATKPYADKRMKFQNYYRNFPRLAMYYLVYDGFYVGKYLGSAKYLLRDPKYTSRLEKLLKWLEDLKTRWKANGFYKKIWNKYPKIGAGRSIVELGVLQDLLSVLAYRRGFRCDHPWIEKLYMNYANLMSDDYNTNILLRFKQVNKKDALMIYEDAIYSSRGELCQYVLKYFCGRELPEEKLLLISQNDYNMRWELSSIKKKEEIKLIEEIINE